MTTDGFTQLIDDSNAFFAELKRNNSKEWFNPRKDEYNRTIKKPAELLADLVAGDISRISGTTWQPKVFRIYRDVRFSKDKTPLNTHLHMMWSQAGDDPLAPVFFFGSEPGDMTVGFGIMGMKGESLARFRAFIDSHGDALVAAIGGAGMVWSDWGPEPLKRVPPPYDADHPHGDLLKKKGMTISAKLDDSWRGTKGGLAAVVRGWFEATLPVQELLREKL